MRNTSTSRLTPTLRHGPNRRDLTEAGKLMQASHASMRDDFEISSAALDSDPHSPDGQHLSAPTVGQRVPFTRS